MVNQKSWIGVFLLCFAFAMLGSAQDKLQDKLQDNEERHIMTSMRMIGHQILLSAGDSTSRVLPVQKINDSYKISFESEFGFYPHKIDHIVDSVVFATEIADSYGYQLVECTSQQVVHSYELLVRDSIEVIPCGTRPTPKDCYALFFHVIEKGNAHQELLNTDHPRDPGGNSSSFSFTNLFYLLIPLIVIFSLYWIFKYKPEQEELDPNFIKLGEYFFDKINMVLIHNDQKTELTGKEAELLELLYANANNTVERNAILAGVWKDEGDYIGRTLDVFISKLRKKLSADETVKIVNIRGVGYKLVLGY